MRIFQNNGVYKSYRTNFDRKFGVNKDFSDRVRDYINDRYSALHILGPILDLDPDSFYTMGDDEILQRSWAQQNGLPASESLEKILLSQIEHHRTEVFYNMDPMLYRSDFVRKLPGCVRHTLAWRAAPSSNADFSAYDRVLNNFPSIIADYRSLGWNAEYFCPSYDPLMDKYADQTERPIDVLFVGSYTRHHKTRSAVLENVAALSGRYNVRFHVERGKLTRLAETPLGFMPSLGQYRRPPSVRKISDAPVFGLGLYEAISSAKIVLNGAIDMAGEDRGNMRCFEALGCGSLLVSDAGKYPAGMKDGQTMTTYTTASEAVTSIVRHLEDWARSREIASRGHVLLKNQYSKQAQWAAFERIVENI